MARRSRRALDATPPRSVRPCSRFPVATRRPGHNQIQTKVVCLVSHISTHAQGIEPMASRAATGARLRPRAEARLSWNLFMTDSILQTPIAKWPGALVARFLRWRHLRDRALSEGPSLSAMLRRSRTSLVAAASDQLEARSDHCSKRGELSGSKTADNDR